jgi:hypothetical protein
MLFVWIVPNTQEIIGRYSPAIDEKNYRSTSLQWRPTVGWAIFIAIIFAGALNGMITSSSKFIYFQF